MTRRRTLTLLALTLAAAVTAWVQTAAAPGAALSRLLPSGALLVLEARDLGGVVTAWNASPEKASWIASPNYAEFSRSKLFLRLQEAQAEFTAAAGLAPDWAFFSSIAGGESALALYDIGDLRFVYVTELASARALQTALWQSRASFEPRRAANHDYYVRADAESGREASFAVVDQLLVLATSSDLTAQTLELMTVGSGDPLIADDAYRAATAEAGERGMLRLVYNLEALVRTPHFRSYWIQENVTALRQFRAGVSDFDLAVDGYRERRRLVRVDSDEQPPAESSAVAELARLAPNDAGLYRAWATFNTREAVELLRDKLLAPRDQAFGYAFQPAPAAPTVAGVVGSESALETLIDTPPARAARTDFDRQPLLQVAEDAGLRGLLHVESSLPTSDFVRRRTAIVLLADGDWNQAAALAALRDSAADLWTSGGVGAQWTRRGDLNSLDGLRSLHAAAAGPLLVVSDSDDLATAILARLDEPVLPGDAVFRGAFRHARESAPYAQLMTRLDYLSGGGLPLAQRTPHLFSENIGSLSRALSRIAEVTVTRRDQGATVTETINYRTAR